MFSKNVFSGYCRERNKHYAGLQVSNAQWLEEMGEMIEVAVTRLRIEQSLIAPCNQRKPKA